MIAKSASVKRDKQILWLSSPAAVSAGAKSTLMSFTVPRPITLWGARVDYTIFNNDAPTGTMSTSYGRVILYKIPQDRTAQATPTFGVDDELESINTLFARPYHSFGSGDGTRHTWIYPIEVHEKMQIRRRLEEGDEIEWLVDNDGGTSVAIYGQIMLYFRER
jgi:hypothetical protein